MRFAHPEGECRLRFPPAAARRHTKVRHAAFALDDGPMFEHGLKAMPGQVIRLPVRDQIILTATGRPIAAVEGRRSCCRPTGRQQATTR